jgi:hypothetical protein
VSGTIRTGGTPLPGVVVSDGTRTATADSLGRYSSACPQAPSRSPRRSQATPSCPPRWR